MGRSSGDCVEPKKRVSPWVAATSIRGRVGGTRDRVDGVNRRPHARPRVGGGEGWGYGEIELDALSLAYLQTGIPGIGDPLVRSVAWSWDALLSGRIALTACSTWRC